MADSKLSNDDVVMDQREWKALHLLTFLGTLTDHDRQGYRNGKLSPSLRACSLATGWTIQITGRTIDGDHDSDVDAQRRRGLDDGN